MMLLLAMARSNAAAPPQCRAFITHPSGFLPSRCLRPLIFYYGPQLLSSREGSALNGREDPEAAARPRLNYRALTDALNALVHDGAATRVSEKPARTQITSVGR